MYWVYLIIKTTITKINYFVLFFFYSLLHLDYVIYPYHFYFQKRQFHNNEHKWKIQVVREKHAWVEWFDELKSLSNWDVEDDDGKGWASSKCKQQWWELKTRLECRDDPKERLKFGLNKLYYFWECLYLI